MRLTDFSPPSSPSLEEQRDALQKGLGRAVQWALARRLDDEALLPACLRDLRHDPEVEGSRGAWLWQMIRATEAADRFRVPILHALYDLSDDRGAHQVCELAAEYARAGDESFRAQLYEIVERKPLADCRTLGEEEIVELDGEPAFLFAARIRGNQLSSREWDWDDGWLVHEAIERFGEGRVADLLDGAEGEAIGRFREGWKRQEAETRAEDPAGSHGDRMRAIGVAEVLSAARAGGDETWSFQSWGRYAGEGDLDRIARHLRAVQDPAALVKLINVFLYRPFPRFDVRLLELCRHDDRKVRRQARYAIANNTHPRIREYALGALGNGLRESADLQLFVRNYEQGDERRILEALDFPDDASERHWLLMGVIKVLEKNPDADASELGLIAYASTPCENCRLHAVRLLHEEDAAPGWLIDECRFDSGEQCRGFIEEITGPPVSTDPGALPP